MLRERRSANGKWGKLGQREKRLTVPGPSPRAAVLIDVRNGLSFAIGERLALPGIWSTEPGRTTVSRENRQRCFSSSPKSGVAGGSGFAET